MKNKIMFGILLAVLMIGAVMAVDWSPSGNVNLKNYYNITNVSNINPGGTPLTIGANLTILDKITFRLGEIIDNIVDGWVRVTGGLNVTESLEVGGNATIGEDLNVTKNIDAENITAREKITATSAEITGDVDMSGGNLTLMDKITFRLGEIIDNIVDGWITITGSLNVTENVTAKHLEGNLSWDYLDTYPVACPEGTYLTELGDSVICTSISAADHDNLTIGDLTVTNITAYDINSILYVQESNASDINPTINKCPSNGCKVIIPSGNYAVDNTINLTSNLSLEILKGAKIYYNTGASPFTIVDQQSDTYNFIIYANGEDNIEILNYGKIQPRLIENPTGQETISYINNATNVHVVGGEVGYVSDAWAFYNSKSVTVEDIYNDEDNGGASIALVWFECVDGGIVRNIKGGRVTEAIDFNAMVQNVVVSDIVVNGSSDSEVIDLNQNKNILLSNINVDYSQMLIRVGETSGQRFAECNWTEEGITPGNIRGVGLSCDNCDLEPVLDLDDVNGSYYISHNGVMEYYGDFKQNTGTYDINLKPNDFGVSSEGLIAYWKAETLDDYSGNGYNITAVNSATTSTGKFGQGFNSNATDVHWTADNVVVPNNLTEFSWFGWVKLSGAADDSHTIFRTGAAGDKSTGMLISATGGSLVCIAQLNETNYQTGKGHGGNHLEWNHYGCVFNTTDILYYFNGELIGTLDVTDNAQLNLSTSYLTINSRSGGSHNVNGTTDQIMLFNRTLDVGEVQSIYELNSEYTSTDAYHMKGTDLTLKNKITFLLGEIIDNLVDGWVRITGNLNVTGNTIFNGEVDLEGNNITDVDWINVNTLNASNEGDLNVNRSNYWDDMNDTNSTQMENSGGTLNILQSWLTSLFYTKSEVDNNLSNYILTSSEGDLNTNSSDYWDDMGSINSTQMENSEGELNIKESWFSTLFDALFGAKSTDDLSEGSTNLYDNQSWNESRGDDLYTKIIGDEGISSEGLIGYWKAETLDDYSGNGYNVSAVNGAGTADGKFGSGFDGDGVDKYFQANSVVIPDEVLTEYSSFAWVKMKDTEGGSTHHVWRTGAGGAESIGVILTTAANNLLCEIQLNNTLYETSYAHGANISEWNHYGCVYNGTDMVFYVNGEEFNNLDVLDYGVINVSTNSLTINSRPGGGYYLNGTSDEILIFNRTVNPDEIKALYEKSSEHVSTEAYHLKGTNLNLRDKITFLLGEVIDNIVDGWVRVAGNLNVTESLNVVGNFTGNQIYGEMYYHNHTGTELNFAVDGQYYHMFMMEADHLNGFSTNNLGWLLNSSLMAQVDGLYEVRYSSIGDGQNNHVYISSIFVNEVIKENCDAHKKMTAGGDVVTMNGDCFVELNKYDNVSIRVADVGGTGTGNYYGSNLNIVRIGT